jgi:hypothetical protein
VAHYGLAIIGSGSGNSVIGAQVDQRRIALIERVENALLALDLPS